MDLMAGDDRSEQARALRQVEEAGREIVADLFSGLNTDEAKIGEVLKARSLIYDHWAKIGTASIFIGKTLLHLSRTLSDEEFRRVRRGSERLFPFSDSVATKLRMAAVKAEEWALPAERLPPYSIVYEISTLSPEGQALVRERGLVRPDVRRADIIAVRRELKAASQRLAAPRVIDEAGNEDERAAMTLSRADIERMRRELLDERARLAARMAEIDAQLEALPAAPA
ncbi:hypothetical protein [Paracraurococcus lichenis]|uniref:DUF3102 domain-containing protein n=1 Tax=Paracraurococcus lichenis TaxID=3064888 RepID=A0ABT9EBZ6_9PROT|nr:hypothetical protein [Paracraurococcus sp. LOR1-02]MDO9713732.1 hypothetical protein [Paracraurococcus sp. LOR1-02]